MPIVIKDIKKISAVNKRNNGLLWKFFWPSFLAAVSLILIGVFFEAGLIFTFGIGGFLIASYIFIETERRRSAIRLYEEVIDDAWDEREVSFLISAIKSISENPAAIPAESVKEVLQEFKSRRNDRGFSTVSGERSSHDRIYVLMSHECASEIIRRGART